MATRPIFTPLLEGEIGVLEIMLDFTWHAGMAISQKQKSISELHTAAKLKNIFPILEISSKSTEPFGVNLSAFNLLIKTKKFGKIFSVESAFQGSKIFEHGGPFKDLIGADPRVAKKDQRTKESGNLIGFEFFGIVFPALPRTLFYDWLYINALIQNPDLANQVGAYNGFSDIEFNPARSINCQAHSVALYRSILSSGHIEEAMRSPDGFIGVTGNYYADQKRSFLLQSKLF